MDFGRIIKESFAIAWDYKSLWIFGLFAGGGSGFNVDPGNFGAKSSDLPWSPGDFTGLPDWTIIAPLLGLALVMFLVFMALNLIFTPALIDAVNRIKRGGIYSFSSSFSTGVDFFGRFLLLMLIVLGLGIAFVGVLAAFVALAWNINSAAGVILLLFAIPVFLAGGALAAMLIPLTQRSMVLRNIGISEAFDEAVKLLRENVGNNVIMLLINIGLSIALVIGMMIVWTIIGVPFAALGLLTDVGIIPAVILAVLIGLPISLIIGGFTGTGMFNLYTLFYIELVEPNRLSAVAAPQAP